MIHHCIRMTLKPGLSDDEVAAGIERTRDATTRIPSIRSWVVGRDFGGDYEYSAISVVEDLDGYEEMMNHPAHLEIDRLGLPLVEKFMSFDITDDPDPEMGAKIAAIHQRRYDSTPDIAGLVSDLRDYTGSAAPGRHA
ncbi:Dabb family protein [Pseudonocardia xinjiangensis]|uniref:Dabb family protein n=1 Tax=Pseudonocardia xinjiangensis TaxID=75289 RepID=UPI003D8A5ABC